jgi:plasmid stabilization system protein ParE
MARKEEPLRVWFSPAARADLLAVWLWNASEYGERRADGYIAYLEANLGKLAASPSLGVPIPEYPGLRRSLVKRRSRGHIVFYRVTENRLEILHIYHIAQDWQHKLGQQG